MTVDVTHPTTTTDRFDRACTMAYDSVKMLAAMAGTIGMVCVGDRFIHSTPDMPDLDNLWDILVVGIPAHVFMVAAFFGSMQLANNIVVILFTTSLTTAVSIYPVPMTCEKPGHSRGLAGSMHSLT